MAEKYSKATQVGSSGTAKGGRIYNTQKKSAVTYSGSAKDIKFNPQQAANTEKADKQRQQQLERRFAVDKADLKRRQDSEAVELEAQQRADMGFSKLAAQVESDELDREQLWEKSSLELEQNHELAQLDLTQTSERNQLEYENSYKRAQMDMARSELSAQSQFRQTQTRFIGTAIQSLIEFGGTFKQLQLKGQETLELAEQPISFGASPASVQRKNEAESIQTAGIQAGIDVANGDPFLQEDLNSGYADASTFNTTRAISARSSVMNLDGAIQDLKAQDAPVVLPDGRTIRPSEATTSADHQAISMAYGSIALTKSGWNDLPAVERAEVAREALQIINTAGINASRDYQKQRQEERVAVALEWFASSYATGDRRGGADVGELTRNYLDKLFKTNKYTSRKSANDAGMREVINFLEYQEDSAALEALKTSPKFVGSDGSPGPAFESTYGKDIQDAIDRIDSTKLSRESNRRAVNDARVLEITQQRHEQLIQAGNNAERVQEIEQETLRELSSIPGKKSRELQQRIRKDGLRNNDNVFYDFQQKIISRDPNVSEDDIQDAFDSGVITSTQWATLNEQLVTSIEKRAAAVKPYEKLIKANAKASVENFGKTGTMDGLGFESRAATYIANTELRYKDALANFLQDNEGGNVTLTDVQTFLAGEKNKFEKELQALVKDNAEASFPMFGARDDFGPTVAEIVHPNTGQKVRDLTKTLSTFFLNEQGVSVNKDDVAFNNVNPYYDRILTKKQMAEALQAYESGEPMPGRTAAIARNLGMSTRNLIKQQAEGQQIHGVIRELERIDRERETSSSSAQANAAAVQTLSAENLAILERTDSTPAMRRRVMNQLVPSGSSGTFQNFYLMAKEAGAKYPELVAAQWQLESASGTAISGTNNFFGMKASGGESATAKSTFEVYNGQTVNTTGYFKNYRTPYEAVEDLVQRWYMDYKSFRGVNNASSAAQAAQMLRDQGYATDPQYVQKLIRIMSDNGFS